MVLGYLHLCCNTPSMICEQCNILRLSLNTFSFSFRPGEHHRWRCRRSAAASGGLWCGSNLGGSRTSAPQQSGPAPWSAPPGLCSLPAHTNAKEQKFRCDRQECDLTETLCSPDSLQSQRPENKKLNMQIKNYICKKKCPERNKMQIIFSAGCTLSQLSREAHGGKLCCLIKR